MKKLNQLLPKLSLYDTTGLSRSVRRSLMMMIVGVVFGNVSFPITGGTALTGYIKALGASDFVYSLLMAAPFVSKFMQLVASYVLEKTQKRRQLMLYIGLFARLMWVPVALVPYFVPASEAMIRIWAILVLVLLLSCLSAFIDVSFNSVIADIVPIGIRGRDFAARQRCMMVSGILSGFVISWILDTFTAGGSLVGYTIVFIIAGIFGAIDVACFIWVDFPAMKKPDPAEKKESMFSMMGEVLHNKRYMRLIVLVTIWTFSVNVAAPFYNVHMIGPMQMTYTEVNILSVIISNAATLIFSGMWGGLMDRYGNKSVLRVFTVLAALLPLLWIPTGPRIIFMVPVVQFLSGMIWPGVDLSLQNLYLNHAPEKNRTMYFAMYFCITQMIGVSFGYTVGGWLVDNVFLGLSEQLKFTLFGFEFNQYQFIFQLSGLLRLAVSLLLLRFMPDSEGDAKPFAMLRDICRHGISGKRGLKA